MPDDILKQIDAEAAKAIRDHVSAEMKRRLQTDGGGPAFPCSGTDGLFGTTVINATGMSLRDYFAAKALAGGFSDFLAGGDACDDYGDFARSCYRLADAMLAERAKDGAK